jgi:hypothetical protein
MENLNVRMAESHVLYPSTAPLYCFNLFSMEICTEQSIPIRKYAEDCQVKPRRRRNERCQGTT